MSKDRRIPRNLNNRILFDRTMKKANVFRTYICSLAFALAVSIVLILVNTIFLNEKLIHFVLPGSFFAIGCGIFAVITYLVMEKDDECRFCDAASYGFILFQFGYLTYLSFISIEQYNSLAFYCIGVMVAAYVVYTERLYYLIMVAVEMVGLAMLSFAASRNGEPLGFSQMLLVGTVHAFGFLLSRDNHSMRTEITRQKLRAKNEKDKAECDPLTGLINRRGLESEVNNIWKFCIQQKMLLGAILIDIDHFKKYNDGFGHVQGDECLKMVAASIEDSVNEMGFSSRIGGEEFMVFMYGLDPKQMYSLAEQIRKDVQDMNIQHATGPNDVVTISLGLYMEKASNELSFTDLYENADKLLYKAKEGGRNRVVSNKTFK